MKFHKGMEVRSTRLKHRGEYAKGVVDYTSGPHVFVDWVAAGVYGDRCSERELRWAHGVEEAVGQEVPVAEQEDEGFGIFNQGL